ncbi:hypothetical protein RJT00_04580, partial [Segatella copri]|uniref:hypothetical protein n=1 Tax=Segatella copri TaxID=165179 RepID=UPI00293B2378
CVYTKNAFITYESSVENIAKHLITELSHVVQERAEGPKAPSPLPFRYAPVTVGSGRVGQNLHTSDRFYSVSAKRNKAFYSLPPNK